MSKLMKWVLVALGVVLIVFAGMRYMRMQTKKASPEETATFYLGDLTVEVNYSRPSKKGRAIFGGLVPYGQVWRTGANEPTTFKVNKGITFGGTRVEAGTYTLWSIPGPDEWSVMLNSKMYGWGINFDGVAQRDPMADVATAKAPVRHLLAPVEQFTIAVGGEPEELTLSWDDVEVGVPLGH